MMKKICAILILFLCVICCFNESKSFSSAFQGITQISSVAQFLAMGESGEFELVCDLDFSEINSYTSKNFYGTLNGNGFKIKNLAIYGETAAGIFNELNGAQIQNLVIENCSVNSGTEYAGILAAKILNSTLSNVEIYHSGTYLIYAKNSANVCGATQNSTFTNVAVIGSVFGNVFSALFCVTATNCIFTNCYAISNNEENYSFIKNKTNCEFFDCYYFSNNKLYQNDAKVEVLTFSDETKWTTHNLINLSLPYLKTTKPPVNFVVPNLPSIANVKTNENFDELKQTLNELIELGYNEFEMPYQIILELEERINLAKTALSEISNFEMPLDFIQFDFEEILLKIERAKIYENNFVTEENNKIFEVEKEIKEKIKLQNESEEEDEEPENPTDEENDDEVLKQTENEQKMIDNLILKIEQLNKTNITEFNEAEYLEIKNNYTIVLNNLYARDFSLLALQLQTLEGMKLVFDGYKLLLKDVLKALNFNSTENLGEANEILESIKQFSQNSILTAKDIEKLTIYENAVIAKISALLKIQNEEGNENTDETQAIASLDLSLYNEAYAKLKLSKTKNNETIVIMAVLLLFSLNFKRIFKRMM